MIFAGVAVLASIAACSERPAAPPPASPAATGLSPIQLEVLQNIRAQPVGEFTVADLNLPEPYLLRVADRVIRSSFEAHFRMIVDQGVAQREDVSWAGAIAEERQAAANAIRTIERAIDQPGKQNLQAVREAVPPLHGFRANWRSEGVTWPFELPAQQQPSRQRAAAIVGARLARDGLMATTVQAIHALGPAEMLTLTDEAIDDLLRSIGLPSELLGCFTEPGVAPADLVRRIVTRFKEGDSTEHIARELRELPFRYQPAQPGFQVDVESGEREASVVRVQLTRGGYWDGPGDGGNVHLIEQLILALPDASFIGSIEQRHLATFEKLARSWPLHREHQFTLIAENATVSQWAQDLGKAGAVAGKGELWLMTPRYPSREEAGSVFIPGEAAVIEGLADAGVHIAQSSLLFQGGNLLAIQEPRSGQRWLLIGEGEIHRNRVLGLTREQIEEAFRIEFGVDRCVVLPVASFHIDYDISIRSHQRRAIALLNDPLGGAKVVLRCALDLLHQRRVLTDQQHSAAQDAMKTETWPTVVRVLGDALRAAQDARGHYPLPFAEQFSTSAVDSGVGNLQRVLLAMDLIVAHTFSRDQWPSDQNTREYYGALMRLEAARLELRQTLLDHNFTVVAVPGLTDGSRGINAINGIHTQSKYLMPAYGGLFAPVDDAARAVIASALPGIQIAPILTAESQRRSGGVHCSVGVHYRAR